MTLRRVCSSSIWIALFMGAAISANGQGSNTVSSILEKLEARELGPAAMSGRVVDIAVYDKAPKIFYVASASGGVWKTINDGITFEPVFAHQASSSIGAVAISQKNPNLVWVGTGEGTERNDVGWGDGIYKSTDGGKTWRNMGLGHTGAFSRIVIDPSDDNVVYAASPGHTWGYNAERGVYKTTDGGLSWKQVLYTNNETGAADLALDSKNPRCLLAAMWTHIRRPDGIMTGGAGSGIYRSTDAGATWHHVTKGLPDPPMGRIGLAYSPTNQNVAVATVDANGTDQLYRTIDGGASWTKMPCGMISYDRGKQKVYYGGAIDSRPFYFSKVRVDPEDDSRIYVLSMGMLESNDSGNTFQPLSGSFHSDVHALWIDPKDGDHLVQGNDGGVYESFDQGKTWKHFENLPIGQIYGVAYDNRKPYWVYGGWQDNGCWAVPTQTTRGDVGNSDIRRVGGGDGTEIQVDPTAWQIVYANGQQFGPTRVNQEKPGLDSDASRPIWTNDDWNRYVLRTDWALPILISPWNHATLYLGTDELWKTVDEGTHWDKISGDLTRHNPDLKTWRALDQVGTTYERPEGYDSIKTISESPVKQGLLWIGTNDGLVQLSRDGGTTWENVTPNIPGLPPYTWCTCVNASRFKEGRAYATFDGHKKDDYATYVYVTEDFGKTWQPLNGNLPSTESCNVIREGIKNPDLLFLGTEHGLYVSLHRGASWTKYQTGDFPTVAIDDLQIHPREEELIIGTHGRSLWILPVEPLEELTSGARGQDVIFMNPGAIYLFGRISQADPQVSSFTSPNTQPGTTFFYYLKQSYAGSATLTVTLPTGKPVVLSNGGPVPVLKGTANAGLNAITLRLGREGEAPLPPAGDYCVELKLGSTTYKNILHIEDVSGQ